MQRLLIHPPFADPTQPYLSLPTLKGYLRARGLDARVLDLNLEAAHFLFRPDRVAALAIELERLMRAPGGHDGDGDGLDLRALRDARDALADLLDARPAPLEVFRDPELFYDRAEYARARRRAEALFAALSAAHHPYRYGFNCAARGERPWSLAALEEYSRDAHSPLDELYREVFEPPADADDIGEGAPRVDLEDVDFIGVSIVFPSQIPEAFYLTRFLKERAPHAFVAFGGPCIHQAAVHMDEERRSRLLDSCDAVGLFEGEETLARLFPALGRLREPASGPSLRSARAASLAEVPNLLFRDGPSGELRRGPAHLLDLREAPAPDYSDLDLDRYLAPSRILLYAPTRGCYWDRCSFCYYGLSETATARYREVPPERAVSDLARLSKRHGARDFYISCDVLSPAYAVRFAQALLDRGLQIRWSCDLKIDKYFTPERCEILARSGLRSAAFGIESGSDRVLALMQKGCDRATMTAVNRSFHASGVATEWMTFTGHPGETAEEALETVRWIDAERGEVDLFIVGEFGLQPGSHIAQYPELYGVREVRFDDEDDFRLLARWRQMGGGVCDEEKERIERAVDALAARYALGHYPWAGAISTHHTFLHFLRFGQAAFRGRRPAHGKTSTARP